MTDDLFGAGGRAWLAELLLPDAARASHQAATCVHEALEDEISLVDRCLAEAP